MSPFLLLLQALASLPELQVLSLRLNSNITKRGLQLLGRATGLVKLDLSYLTAITDMYASLSYLWSILNPVYNS